MSTRRIVVFLIVALAGYSLLAFVYPQVAPAARLDIRMDRQQAIAIARQHAMSLYPDAGSWPSGVETEVRETAWEYLRRNPRPELAKLISPILVTVQMPSPGTSRSVEVTLGASGQLQGLSQPGTSVSTKPSGQAATSTLSPKSSDEQKQLAETSLQKIAGSDWPNYVFKSASASATATRAFTWERSVAGEDRVNLIASATVENDIVSQSSISPDFSRSFTSSLRKGSEYFNYSDAVYALVLFIGLLLSLIVYFRHVINKEVRHTSTLLIGAIAFTMIFVGILFGTVFDNLYSGIGIQAGLSKYYVGVIIAVVLCVLLALIFTIPFFLLWGGGYPEAQARTPNALTSLELLIRGGILTRSVGASILAGVALGWILPLLSALGARIGFGTNVRLAFESTLGEVFFSRAPLLTLPMGSNIAKIYIAFVLFAFMVPFISRRIRKATLVHAFVIVAGTLCIFGSDEFYAGVFVVALTSIITLVFLDRLTVWMGLLASLAALLSGDFAVKLSLLGVLSVGSLQRYSWIGWTVLGLIAIASAAVALRGKVLNDIQSQARWFPEDQGENREERQRLKAQFSVAQKAQQQMLPSAPPIIPGVEISGDCRPAREVGGDLFEYLDLPDGRLGIVVADVSGKGVPASLYMTLTKGLLASVSETTSDPGEIVREVNRHLYVACQRKMFVTLLLGVLDMELRTFSYARAGHNPPVLRRAADGEITLLSAHGIGLGLNSGDIFDRSLQIGEIKLEPHDLLILYSDGISEAMNATREEYGEARLKSVASRADGLNAEQVKELILNDVKSFLGRTPPQDDQTLVVVRMRD